MESSHKAAAGTEVSEKAMHTMTDMDRPLTVISNRAPYQLKTRSGRLACEKNVGGLVSVLDEVLCRTGGTWIAWGGKDNIPEHVGIPLHSPQYSLRMVSLTESEINNYYDGFSNRILWPLSHYFLDRCHFRTDYWRAYQAANEKFALAYRKEQKDSDFVWVHDFHLALLPGLLRKEGGDLSIGFFWHIPFPASPVFRVLPWRKEILQGLLGSDLIGFHLALHADNFLQAVEDVLKVPVDRDSGSVYYEGRVIQVKAFPIGIDFQKWNELAASPAVVERAQLIRRGTGVDKVILGVDRLDYTKGIRERLLAYERFLEKFPEFHGKVCLIQIAVPSRTRVEEYRSLRREIDEAIGRITGRFSRRRWIPLRYLYHAFPMEEVASYYLAADLALITPLRDGMNLVAKEYIASRVQGDGSLILSEFTGASQVLTDAILVNPYDLDALAAAIHLSLSMPEAERRRSMERLRREVRDKDVYWWCGSFLNALMGKKHRGHD